MKFVLAALFAATSVAGQKTTIEIDDKTIGGIVQDVAKNAHELQGEWMDLYNKEM